MKADEAGREDKEAAAETRGETWPKSDGKMVGNSEKWSLPGPGRGQLQREPPAPSHNSSPYDLSTSGGS